MTVRTTCTRWLVAAALVGPRAAPAQGPPPEVAELRRRVAVIRAGMPAITDAAEYAVDLFTRDTTLRFLVPISYDPAMRLEMYWRAGGPPDTGDAGNADAHGIVILPVHSWQGSALAIAAMVEHFQNLGRAVFVLGSTAEKPSFPLGRRLLDNGAPDGAMAQAGMNDVANIVVLWTFYSEIIAAATRRGWEPGIYLSVLMPYSDRNNNAIHFRMPVDSAAVPVIPAGRLGNQYLDAIDTLLATAGTAEHQATIQQAADSLRARRAAGAKVFVATCGHYLQESLQRDTVNTPFRPIDWRWDVVAKLQQAGAHRGDGMLWFAYGGYDCPNVEVAQAFADAGLRVVVASDRMPPGNSPGSIAATIPLAWKLPDAAVTLPFPPGSASPTASVDMVLHYLWLKRLVGTP